MSIEYIAAEDEMFGIVNGAWIAAYEAQNLDYVPQLFFPGQLELPPQTKQIYARCSFSVVTDKQIGLANAGGLSLYETVGLLAVQVYAPKTVVSSFRSAKQIASLVRDAFCKSSVSGELWFRDQKLTPTSGNETMNQVNVVVTCTFKTTK